MSQVAASDRATVAATTATASANAVLTGSGQTGSGHEEVREYEKIIQFRDTVVSGKHPRIKVPASSVVKNAAATTTTTTQFSSSNAPEERVVSSSTHLPINSNAANGQSLGNMPSLKANSQQPAVTISTTGSSTFIPGVSRPSFGTGKPEIDPILLQKSDGLVKAEMQIRRQRLEKVLRDEVEQQKSSVKGSNQSFEQLHELDISDILAKALTLVQATAPPAISNMPSPTANASDVSDSFDEHTFYSSQPDTPELPPSVPARDVLRNVEVQHAPASALALAPAPATAPAPTTQTNSYALPPNPFLPLASRPPQTDTNHGMTHGQGMVAQSANLPPKPTTPLQNSSMAGTMGTGSQNLLNHDHLRRRLETQVISSDSRDASRSENSGNTDSEHSADPHGLQNPPQLVPNPSFRHHEQPLIRGHNLSPFAPQPAHVSPLAVARQPQIHGPESSTLQRAPAQVTTLRQEHAVVISPESSPQQGEKGSKKRNNKKKNKRKADARSQDVQASPRIKPEPRSPSPLTAPPFLRPQKRARRHGRQEPDTTYDEAMLEQPSPQLQQGRYHPTPMHGERVPQGHEGVDDVYSRQVRASVGPIPRELESPLYEERRPDGSIVRYLGHVPSPAHHFDPYGAGDPRPVRTSSYALATPDIHEMPAYPREGRMSVRPYGDRPRSRSPIMVDRRSSAMPPPSMPPRRIVIDEYGREYIEPIRATPVPRQPVMPPPRTGDHDVLYERTPMRSASRIPAAEIIGEDGAIYRRASPGYAPRRVFTQPEYGAGLRNFQERDYPVQTIGPSGQEFVQIRTGAEHVPREYLARSASTRPVEPTPYDRLTSLRPDIPPREYAASVHPDARREMAPHGGRDYNVRPTEMAVPPPGYGVRPIERYYEQSSRDGDVTYVERPRVVHEEVIYPGSGAPRQVYQ